jgi:hypothetical protein
MELDTTTFGFAFRIRPNSSAVAVAAGSDSAVGQQAFMTSNSRRAVNDHLEPACSLVEPGEQLVVVNRQSSE